MPQDGASQVIRVATFEVDLQAQELRKAGLRLSAADGSPNLDSNCVRVADPNRSFTQGSQLLVMGGEDRRIYLHRKMRVDLEV